MGKPNLDPVLIREKRTTKQLAGGQARPMQIIGSWWVFAPFSFVVKPNNKSFRLKARPYIDGTYEVPRPGNSSGIEATG